MPTTMNLTPTAGGNAVNIPNVSRFQWLADRPAAANGHLGMAGHRLQPLLVEWKVMLPTAGKVKQDLETCMLAAEPGENAYFNGEILYARPEDPKKTVRMYRFHGHIETIGETFNGDNVNQTLEIAITQLDVGDAEFRQNQPA